MPVTLIWLLLGFFKMGQFELEVGAHVLIGASLFLKDMWLVELTFPKDMWMVN